MYFDRGGHRPALDPMERRRQSSVIKRKAINFTKIVSLVGIRHATDARNSAIRRIIWIGWLLAGGGFAICQVVERVEVYLEYPLKTDVEFVTNTYTLPMPQVTICNNEPVHPSKTEAAGLKGILDKINEAVRESKKTDKEADNAKENRNLAKNKLRDSLQELHNKTFDSWEELSRNVSQTPDEAIIEARFANRRISNKAEIITTDQGYCFAFSTKMSPLESMRGGSTSGLFLILDTGSPHSAGFKLLVHDPHEMPRMINAPTAITLPKGKTVNVAISFENISYEGPPYYNCNKAEPTYKSSNCLYLCDQEIFRQRCGCRDIYMKDEGNWTTCSYGEVLNCTKYFKLNLGIESNSTKCTCQTQCYTRNYKASVTETLLPTATPLLNGENRLHVYVYYKHLTYIEATNTPEYEWLELLCDIGGALSLLLGATLLTVYEIIEFVILVLKDYLIFRFGKYM